MSTLKTTQTNCLHNSPTIGTGSGIALFQKLKYGESSDKVYPGGLPLSVLLSVCVTLTGSWNAILGPEETRKLSFCLYIIMYQLFMVAKTDAGICPHVQTAS